MACLSFMTILISIVVGVVEAAGLLFCCPFYDGIRTSLTSSSKSLPESYEELVNMINEIKELSSSNENEEWLSGAQKIVEEARLLLLQQNRSSNHNNDRRSCFCFGDGGSQQGKLLRKVREMLLDGQIIITSANLQLETSKHNCGDPQEGTSAGIILEGAVEPIPVVPFIEQGTTREKTLEEKVEHSHDFTNVEEGASKEKPLRQKFKHVHGIPGTKDHTSAEEELKQIVNEILGVVNITVDTIAEKMKPMIITNILGIPDSPEGTTAELKRKVTEHILGIPHVEEGVIARKTLGQTAEHIHDFPDIKEGTMAEEPLQKMVEYIHGITSTKDDNSAEEKLKQIVEQILAILNIKEDEIAGKMKKMVIKNIIGIPEIPEGTTAEELKQMVIKHILGIPHAEEGAISKKSLKKTAEHIHDFPSIKEGAIKEKPLQQEVKHLQGFPSTKDDTTVEEKLEQKAEQILGILNIEEDTIAENMKQMVIGKILGIPDIQEDPTPEEMKQIVIKQLLGIPNVEEGAVAEGKLERTVGPTHSVPNIDDYVTAGKSFGKMMDMLNNDGVWSIGIWGPGGVGKTTLINILNNKLQNTQLSDCPFSLIILIEIGMEADTGTVQKALAERTNVMVEEGMSTGDIAYQIHKRLQKENFLLVLDNVWEFVDLPKIGIPGSQMSSKIVMTTRSLQVCKTMEAKVIKMNYLNETEAWLLFAQQVGNAVYEEGIRPIAETVCKECGGLPLALVSIGSSMRGETGISRWQDALEKLQSSTPINDIVLQAYHSLKLSYDSLNNENLKSCFLYCSLYSMRSSIGICELVECWLAENLIDNNLDYVDASIEGLGLIQELTNCSLLEEGEGWQEDEEVKIWMHDMVCHVARWIAESEGKSLVFSGHGISKGPNIGLPMEVNNQKWISFVENKEIELPKYVTYFPNATTVIIDGNIVRMLGSDKLLQGFGALRVLNVKDSWGFQVSLPPSMELHALLLHKVWNSKELPYVPSLVILNLSHSTVRKLPGGMEQLTNLKVLNLSNTSLESTGVNIIWNLQKLEVLHTGGSSYKWPTKSKRHYQSRNATLQDLSRLQCLKAVYMDLADAEGNYGELLWMGRLKSFHLNYARWWRISDTQIGEKIVRIEGRRSEQTKIGSFIFHAEKLHLYECKVDEALLQFYTSENYSSSKLKLLRLDRCLFSDETTETTHKYSIFSDLEELRLSVIDDVSSISEITNDLGKTCPELRSLEIHSLWDLELVFHFHGLHMKMPKLEKITVRKCRNLTKIFHFDPTETQSTIPNLKILVVDDLPMLRRLSDYEWNDQWKCLETLIVTRCSKLKKLPRMSSIKVIRGSIRWWSCLKWESEETRSFMNQRFKPCNDRFRKEWLKL